MIPEKSFGKNRLDRVVNCSLMVSEVYSNGFIWRYSTPYQVYPQIKFIFFFTKLNRRVNDTQIVITTTVGVYLLLKHKRGCTLGNISQFLPFTALTNGEETNGGGGRYIDLNIPTGETIVIDFNKAYSPSYAYNYNYSCPIPPKENDLDIAITAGVKNLKL